MNKKEWKELISSNTAFSKNYVLHYHHYVLCGLLPLKKEDVLTAEHSVD